MFATHKQVIAVARVERKTNEENAVNLFLVFPNYLRQKCQRRTQGIAETPHTSLTDETLRLRRSKHMRCLQLYYCR